MDGRGRAFDNVFIERLWRSVKYEEVYLRDYADGWEAEASLERYLAFYCGERIHQALAYRTPQAVYRGETLPAAGQGKRIITKSADSKWKNQGNSESVGAAASARAL